MSMFAMSSWHDGMIIWAGSSIFLSIDPSIPLSIRLSIRPFIHLPIYLELSMYLSRSTSPWRYLSFHVSTNVFIHRLVPMSYVSDRCFICFLSRFGYFEWPPFSHPLLSQDENGTLLESDLVNMNGPAESFITGVAGDGTSSGNPAGSSELGSTAGVLTFKILSQNCPT